MTEQNHQRFASIEKMERKRLEMKSDEKGASEGHSPVGRSPSRSPFHFDDDWLPLVVDFLHLDALEI